MVMGLLLALPWVLVGLTVLGAAASAVGRWLDRRRRPHPIRKHGQFKASQSGDNGGESSMSSEPAASIENKSDRLFQRQRNSFLRTLR